MEYQIIQIFLDFRNETITTLRNFKINKINNFFIDVGANYGTYSLYFSKNFKKIYSMKHSKIFKLLQFNCEISKT